MRLRFWRRRRKPVARPPRPSDVHDRPPIPAGYGVGTEVYLIDKVRRGEMTASEFVTLSRAKSVEQMTRRGQIRTIVRPGEPPTGPVPSV